MKSKLRTTPTWRFTGDDESFEFLHPEALSRMYFPLCNDAGLLSSITPILHGDIKRDQNHFLMLPLSAEDLHNTRSARNFWVNVESETPWSAVGSSGTAQSTRFDGRDIDSVRLNAGALWHLITRENRRLGLRAEILSFAPATQDTVEIMQVRLTNISRRPLTFTPTAAIPVFGRSADNLRDHRHVTSLLHRTALSPHGILVTPTMSFDERGHKINTTVYGVLGCEESGVAPVAIFPTVASFVGEGGSFDAPEAVFAETPVRRLSDTELQGREAIGALRFKRRKLLPGRTATYTLFLGIADDRARALSWVKTYGTPEKVASALVQSKAYWKNRLDSVQLQTGDRDFDRWVRWVSLQPILRKIFGCSFLPDFDYGRGGRGWRDLWQDCLGLLLLEAPDDAAGAVRQLLLDNFGGVRINGSNATIIGRKPGEFIADRNNISRMWMDHGVWPWITTELYIHQTGDLAILSADVPYFWDQDRAAAPSAEKGSVLEHILAQHLTSYFDVGEHGNIRLRDADWNDGLDMAHERGESVAFTAVYAGNLLRLAKTLTRLQERGVSEVPLASELNILFEDRAASTGLAPQAKRQRLATYRERTKTGVSGEKPSVRLAQLIADLTAKGEALAAHVRQQEWLEGVSGQSWFNGYYDNDGKRVEGDHTRGVRMTLTGQVFPIMSGVADDKQVAQSFAAAKKFLLDRKLGGFRLNTNFGEIQPALGRAFSFAYGEKENGAVFSHMVVMFANALYQRGFVAEGYETLIGLYDKARDANRAKIYPGLPEYFNAEGRGLYLYLTGSASWYVLTVVTQMLGIRGLWGDLLLAPKLVPQQFDPNGNLQAQATFAGKRLDVTYQNLKKKPYTQYTIQSITLDGQSIAIKKNTKEITIPRATLEAVKAPKISISVTLG